MKYDKSDIGTGLFEAVTFGLYGDNINCIREYIQNAVDAKAKNISIYFENTDTLVIRDDGKGMNAEDFELAFKLGVSNKTDDDVGWRGIGIWSGVSTCERLVFISKKIKNGIYRIEVDCNRLRKIFKENPKRPLEETLTEVTGEIESIPLGKSVSIENDQYTEVRLESIRNLYKKIMGDEFVRNYLSRTVPAPFDETKFSFAGEINQLLKNGKVKFSNVNIEFNRKKIYRYPDQSESFFGVVTPKIFKYKNKTIAIGWLLQSSRNKVVENYGGVLFKKKGFTIGDDSLVKKLYPKITYNPWQYGEIHIIEESIRETSARNNFEYDNEYIEPFLNDAAEYLTKLQVLNEYQSQTNVEELAKGARNALDKGKPKDAKDKLDRLYQRVSITRQYPDDPALKEFKQLIDEKRDNGLKIASEVEKDLEGLGYIVIHPEDKSKKKKSKKKQTKEVQSATQQATTQIKPPILTQKEYNIVWSIIHPAIINISKNKFDDGYYANAVEDAMKEVINRVKNYYYSVKNKEQDGIDLMFKSFYYDSKNPTPVILLDNLTTKQGEDIQRGYSFLFAGATAGIRNPRAHKNQEIDKNEAMHMLYVSSLLMYTLDKAKVP